MSAVRSHRHLLKRLRRWIATGLTGLLMIANEGDVLLAWHNVNTGLKDNGIQLQAWLDQWRESQRSSPE